MLWATHFNHNARFSDIHNRRMRFRQHITISSEKGDLKLRAHICRLNGEDEAQLRCEMAAPEHERLQLLSKKSVVNSLIAGICMFVG
jgi:hypothetical protein